MEHLSMTTNFRVRMRREHDSDERFTRREHARILTHISSVRRVCERAPKAMTLQNLVFCSIQSRTTTNTLRVQEYTIASSNAYIWFLKFSLHILEHELVLCFIECLRFWVVHMLWSYRIPLSHGVYT